MSGVSAFFFAIAVQFAIVAAGIIAIVILLYALAMIGKAMDWANDPSPTGKGPQATYSFRPAASNMGLIGHITELSDQRLHELHREAEGNAARRWPLYGISPGHAALMGFGVSYMHLLIFFVVAGLDQESFMVAQWVYFALGAIIPALVVWFRERTHYRCWNQEFERLRQIELERFELM